ncbi:DUF262 domain-containing protein [Brachyspira pulli]|uniref:DUF262 domain-containing protein n=1 Tax=Brachyspira pulli TaxID=310721 RepID=UPI003004D91F
MSELKTGIYSLSELITNNEKSSFIVPIYQRLYVWKDEQVNKFIDDIYNSYKENKIDEYYIGNVLFLENNYDKTNEQDIKFDIVDGQQRFTTLFIILKNFIRNNGIIEEIKSIFYSNDSKCRLKFLAREYANIYFEDNNAFCDNEEMYTLINSFNIINNKLKELINEDKKEFISFIINKVKFSLTIIPNNENTNINKLFEVMNSTSVQLEQHQILKAKILHKISNNNDVYSLCASIWDLVSSMDKSLFSNKRLLEKIIKNIKVENSISNMLYKKIDNDSWDEDKDSKNENFEDKNSENKDAGYKNIFEYNFDQIENIDKKSNNNTIQTNTSIKSIINFNYFLMHTLRIFYLFYNKSYNIDKLIVDDTKLIFIFANTLLNDCSEDDIMKFFDLLLAARLCFDEYIVKWQDDILAINSERENTSKFEVLQTLLYHSQSEKRYWLTPLLYKTLTLYKDAIEKITDETLYNYLLKLEHILYCGYYTKGDNEAQKTLFISLEDKEDLFENENIDNKNDIENRYGLSDDKGTDFNHYIFYKLDFILYYYLEEKNADIPLNIDYLEKEYEQLDIKNLIDNYRIISRNSIEHVIAQHSKDEKEKIIKNKDSFGNLVLISSNYNSSYSNESFKVKKPKFISKTKNNNRLDSIKSLIIYLNDNFSDEQILEHRDQMIKIIKNYDDDIKKLNI